MDYVFWNILLFILTTIFYFVTLKPALTLQQQQNASTYSSFLTNKYLYLGVYFLIVLVVQFGLNMAIINTKCGGNVSANIGYTGAVTLFPWAFIFGGVLVLLVIFPGFKSAFSDVIGYYWVASSANNLFKELIINVDIQDDINRMKEIPNANKKDVENTIVSIFGDSSVLINKIVPENFNQYWDVLKPIMKPGMYGNQQEKEKLLKVVVERDNVGEAMWYLYTGILLCCIVQYNISTRGCKVDIKTMKANYDKFLEKESATIKEQQKTQNTVYTVS
jgi:hypothetical protein